MQNQQLLSLLRWEAHDKFSVCLHLFINFSGQPWLKDVFLVCAGSGSLLGILTKERNQEAGARAQDPSHLLALTSTERLTLKEGEKGVTSHEEGRGKGPVCVRSRPTVTPPHEGHAQPRSPPLPGQCRPGPAPAPRGRQARPGPRSQSKADQARPPLRPGAGGACAGAVRGERAPFRCAPVPVRSRPWRRCGGGRCGCRAWRCCGAEPWRGWSRSSARLLRRRRRVRRGGQRGVAPFPSRPSRGCCRAGRARGRARPGAGQRGTAAVRAQALPEACKGPAPPEASSESCGELGACRGAVPGVLGRGPGGTARSRPKDALMVLGLPLGVSTPLRPGDSSHRIAGWRTLQGLTVVS